MLFDRLAMAERIIRQYDQTQRGRHQEPVAVAFPPVLGRAEQGQNGDGAKQESKWNHGAEGWRSRFVVDVLFGMRGIRHDHPRRRLRPAQGRRQAIERQQAGNCPEYPALHGQGKASRVRHETSGSTNAATGWRPDHPQHL
jgi:hypothetical protein